VIRTEAMQPESSGRGIVYAFKGLHAGMHNMTLDNPGLPEPSGGMAMRLIGLGRGFAFGRADRA